MHEVMDCTEGHSTVRTVQPSGVESTGRSLSMYDEIDLEAERIGILRTLPDPEAIVEM